MRIGIFRVAEQAAKNYKDAEQQELGLLDQFTVELGTNFEYSTKEGVNKPKILDGMTPIKFTIPVGTSIGETILTNESDPNWYSYADKQWANAQTQDGSMWVWIPRYAYKIVYTNPSNKSEGGTVDVKFLIGTTDNYYDENGNIQIAKRAQSATEIVDTTTGYTVHPAFTNETSIQYANGGWDKELTGIWVAKFTAGYAGGGKNDSNNDITPVDSGETYSGTYSGIKNYYGSITSGTTTMKYPVFMGQTYAYNYINVGDSYKLAKSLTKTRNPYGLNNTETDSHQMKNSEWGAVVYLTHSPYGLNGQNLLNINNVDLNNQVNTIYAVTGYAGEGTDTAQNQVTTAPTNLGESISNGTLISYAWYTTNGQKGSSTQNITGVYDLSGGVWERTSAYIENSGGVSNRNFNGGSLIAETNLKYKTIYPHNSSNDSNADNWNEYKAINRYGDAILETSTSGSGAKSWNGDYSNFPNASVPFFIRGGSYGSIGNAGTFAFYINNGSAYYNSGFRAVLCAL